VHTSGQLPIVDGVLLETGTVGASVTAERAAELAAVCALNAIAAVKSVAPLDSVTRIVKVTGFVASAPDFTGQPTVMNGASNLLLEAFGDIGRHARSSLGVAVLPMDAPVEVEMIVELGE
jgi:enamine deaminase RidA (YjgF/YER057c/UK114 family)